MYFNFGATKEQIWFNGLVHFYCIIFSNYTYIPGSYIRTADGKLCTEQGLEIASENECKAAASELSLTWAYAWTGPGDFPGCLFANDGRSKVYFNLSPNPGRERVNNKYAAICRSGNTSCIL